MIFQLGVQIDAYLYVEVSEDEQETLRSLDGRSVREDRVFTNTKIQVFRQSLVAFISAAIIRPSMAATISCVWPMGFRKSLGALLRPTQAVSSTCRSNVWSAIAGR